jgi:hypothetical protein
MEALACPAGGIGGRVVAMFSGVLVAVIPLPQNPNEARWKESENYGSDIVKPPPQKRSHSTTQRGDCQYFYMT